jgi:hypothetical protein
VEASLEDVYFRHIALADKQPAWFCARSTIKNSEHAGYQVWIQEVNFL